MAKTWLIVLAALLSILGTALATTATAQAVPASVTSENQVNTSPAWPFLRGTRDNHDLARAIRESLRRDPTGNTRINASNCGARGCATPQNFLESYQHDTPELTLGQLVDYIDSFVPVTLTAEQASWQWDMDCIHPIENGALQVVINCLNRRAHAGETFFADPRLLAEARRTNSEAAFARAMKLAHDCANPIRGRHEDLEPIVSVAPARPCIIIRAAVTDTNRHLQVGGYRNGNMPSRCWGWRRLGETEWRPLERHCIAFCSMRNLIGFYGRELMVEGVVPLEGAGVYEIQVPPPVAEPEFDSVVGFCIDDIDAVGRVRHSDSQGVVASDFTDRVATLNPFVYGEFRRTRP